MSGIGAAANASIVMVDTTGLWLICRHLGKAPQLISGGSKPYHSAGIMGEENSEGLPLSELHPVGFNI